MIITPVYATVKKAYYHANKLVVECELRGEPYMIELDNGGFTDDNPALLFMAYCGVSPSTLDEIEGARIPMTMGQDMCWHMHQSVYGTGKWKLDNMKWFNG